MQSEDYVYSKEKIERSEAYNKITKQIKDKKLEVYDLYYKLGRVRSLYEHKSNHIRFKICKLETEIQDLVKKRETCDWCDVVDSEEK